MPRRSNRSDSGVYRMRNAHAERAGKLFAGSVVQRARDAHEQFAQDVRGHGVDGARRLGHCDLPSGLQVDAVLDQYINEVKELYAAHGSKYNLPPTKELTVL